LSTLFCTLAGGAGAVAAGETAGAAFGSWVNAVENEVGKAIDDQNKETIEGMAHHD
jgi:hypothetical protein